MKFFLIILFLSASLRETQAAPPNIVFILIDDLNHYGVGAYGAQSMSETTGLFKNAPITTPRMDKLAAEGLLCTQAFACPLCENTRVSLMSGKHNNRNLLAVKSQHASDITFGDVFQRAGYATCIAGKWKQTRGTQEIAGKDYISQFGWDEFCCFDVVTAGRRYINPNLIINGQVKNYSAKDGVDPSTGRRWYGPDVTTHFALDFIERHKDQPFFLYYPMELVHDEHKPTPDTQPHSLFDEFDDAIDNKNGHHGDDKKYFPDMLAYTDKLIGKIVDKVDALGLRQNTLIVILGDNGTKEPFSFLLADGSTYPGGKGGTTDTGTHVPLILSYPGLAGKYSGVVDLTDLYPTFCESAGITPPNAADIDGISFWQQALGKKSAEHRQSSYAWFNGNNLVTDTSELLEYAWDKHYKRYAPDTFYPNGRFFDLRADPLETGGKTKVKGPGWNKWYHSGLELDQLTAEQKAAYERLGEVIASHRYTPVTALKIREHELKLNADQSAEVHAETIPANATRNNVIWDSSDPAVASVDKFGHVTAHKPGTVKVSVYSWEDAHPRADNAAETFSRSGITAGISVQVR